jgi:hypothetical protein
LPEKAERRNDSAQIAQAAGAPFLFCRHIGKANPFGGGITLKTATLRRGQRHPL